MRPRWYMAIVASFLAVTGAFAEEQQFVSSSYPKAVTKTKSYFDAWSPSATKRNVTIEKNQTRVWEALQYVTYRVADQSLQGLRMLSQPVSASAPLEPVPTFA